MSRQFITPEEEVLQMCKGSILGKMVKSIIKHGSTMKLGCVVKFADLPEEEKFVILTICRQLLWYSNKPGSRFSFEVRRQSAIMSTRSRLDHPSGRRSGPKVSEQDIEIGVDIFEDMYREASRKYRLFIIADTVVDRLYEIWRKKFGARRRPLRSVPDTPSAAKAKVRR